MNYTPPYDFRPTVTFEKSKPSVLRPLAFIHFHVKKSFLSSKKSRMNGEKLCSIITATENEIRLFNILASNVLDMIHLLKLLY